MALSRKHFERVAEILGTTNVPEKTIEKFVQFFYEENPRFDYDRFYDAVDKHAQVQRWSFSVAEESSRSVICEPVEKES